MSLYARDAYLLSEYTPITEYEQETRQVTSLPVGLSVKPYPVPRFTVTIPLLGFCSGWVGRPVSITWDPMKTTVTASRLMIKVKPSADPVAMDIKFNDTIVKSFWWGEGAKGEQSDLVDVPVINGTNLFEAKGCKHIGWIGIVDFDVDAYLEVTFEGETPQRPWGEVVWEWLETNWPYLAIATGVVIIGGVTYSYITRPGGR